MPPKGRIIVNEIYCKGCEMCVVSCPQHSISLAADRITPKGYHPAAQVEDTCTGCGICAVVCPEAAIVIFRQTPQRVPSA